jgi:UDP:flavonoid glycosyltransferase YjiC (YdhE family)
MATNQNPTPGMRVLFSCCPAIGHFYPLLPLARALREHGCAVAFLTSSCLSAAVRAEGFELLPAGPGIEALVPEALRRHAVLAALPPDQLMTMRAAIPLFADVRVDLTLSEALVEAQLWHPDFIISEHADLVGPLVAAKLGAALATLGFGPGHPAEWVVEAGEAVAPYYRELGLTPPADAGLYGGLYLDTCPPALQAPQFARPARVQSLRPEPYSNAVAVWTPPNFGDRADRPLVLLTMGTIFGTPAVFSAALAGLAALDVNVLVTVGPLGDPAAIAADPTRVWVERFAPINRLLDRCDLVVSRGGAGTTLAALSRGIPMVVIPQATDQFINAERAVASGAAVSLLPTELDPEALRSAVERVWGDHRYAAAAACIRDEVAAMPDATDVASLLVAAPVHARENQSPWQTGVAMT